MKKILSLIIIGLLCFSMLSVLAPQVSAQVVTLPWRDDFDYQTKQEMRDVGWILDDWINEQGISVGGGIVRLDNDGTEGSAIRFIGHFPSSVHDFKVETKSRWVGRSYGYDGNFRVYTERHSYGWYGNGFYNDYRFVRDNNPVENKTPGYNPVENVWTIFTLEKKGNKLYMYHDGELKLTYTELDEEPDELVGVHISCGWISTMEYDYISVEVPTRPPVADFTYSPTSPDIFQKVHFDASTSYDPDDGNITSYVWDFGDENSESDMITNHKYKSEGTYTVTLTVTDDDGQTGTASAFITVAIRMYYELRLEIDWLEGHAPSHESLAYIINYFKESARTHVLIHFNEEISLDAWHQIDPDERTTKNEFEQFEGIYNNLGDDKIDPNPVYTSKWKWILFGARWTKPETGGLTFPYDINRWAAGNYIFIADDLIFTEEIETVVLMHEFGHSIGIWDWGFNDEIGEWEENYDAIPWSVMTRADNYRYNNEIDETYSPHYWKMRNMEYYEI